MIFRLFLFSITIVSFFGCASLRVLFISKKDCTEMNTDSYNYGKTVALRMNSITFKKFTDTCAKKYQLSLNQKEFNKGYTQGIYEYGKQSALKQMLQNSFDTNYKEIYAEKKDQIRLQEEFNKGYKKGLEELCTKQGGYRVGLSGEKNFMLCPKKKQPIFSTGYAKGRIEYLETKVSQMYDSCNSCCPPCNCDPCACD